MHTLYVLATTYIYGNYYHKHTAVYRRPWHPYHSKCQYGAVVAIEHGLTFLASGKLCSVAV